MSVTLDKALDRSQLLQFWRYFLDRAPPESGPVFLSQRRVYVLPTRHGCTFGVALVLMLLGSINYGLSLGYILTFLLAGMAVVSILHTYRNLAHLTLRAGRVEPAFAGGNVVFRLHVENAATFDRIGIAAHCRQSSATANVRARNGAELALALPAPRRGAYRLPRVTIETRYPVGLVRAWGYFQPQGPAIVYPRPLDTPLPALDAVPERGDAADAGTGTDDYAGLRPYQPSDSPRHIAWKAVARSDQILTKVFVGRGASELWLDWHQFPPATGDEERLSRLAAQVLRAEDGSLVYGLRLPGRSIEPASGDAHRDACLEALARFGTDG